LPVITVSVPLLADPLATIGTVPEEPDPHCTVIVLFPLATTVAIVAGGFVGFDTTNCPAYGAANVKGAGDGGRLNIPVAVKTTWPFGKF